MPNLNTVKAPTRTSTRTSCPGTHGSLKRRCWRHSTHEGVIEGMRLARAEHLDEPHSLVGAVIVNRAGSSVGRIAASLGTANTASLRFSKGSCPVLSPRAGRSMSRSGRVAAGGHLKKPCAQHIVERLIGGMALLTGRFTGPRCVLLALGTTQAASVVRDASHDRERSHHRPIPVRRHGDHQQRQQQHHGGGGHHQQPQGRTHRILVRVAEFVADRGLGQIGSPRRTRTRTPSVTRPRPVLARERAARRRASPLHPSTLSSAQPGSVAGLLFRKTIRRVLGKGRFEASARL